MIYEYNLEVPAVMLDYDLVTMYTKVRCQTGVYGSVTIKRLHPHQSCMGWVVRFGEFL